MFQGKLLDYNYVIIILYKWRERPILIPVNKMYKVQSKMNIKTEYNSEM